MYIGETNRLHEQHSLRTGLLTHFVVGEHQHHTGHKIRFDIKYVLSQTPFHFPWKLLKSRNIPLISVEIKDTHWQQVVKQ